MKQLNNKIAVVTGGNSGIGYEIAMKLSEQGAKVAIFDKKINNIEAGDNLFLYQGDLKQLSEIENFYKSVYQVFGKIDIIAASAGIGKIADLNEVTEKLFDEIISINLKGTYFTVQKSLNYINDNSSIILISSTAAHRAVPGKSIYAATKAAISRLAKNFAADLAHRKIRVNAISPGTIKTPMLGNDLSDDFMKKIGNHIPFKYIGSPNDIAEYAVFLASDKSKYITGTDLTIDGGLSNFIV